jgi:hypothetical protein
VKARTQPFCRQIGQHVEDAWIAQRLPAPKTTILTRPQGNRLIYGEMFS